MLCKRLQVLDFSINMTACVAYAGYLQGGPWDRGHPYGRAPHVLPSNQTNLLPPKCRRAAELGSGNESVILRGYLSPVVMNGMILALAQYVVTALW